MQFVAFFLYVVASFPITFHTYIPMLKCYRFVLSNVHAINSISVCIQNFSYCLLFLH
jgi:hypothetical protein